MFDLSWLYEPSTPIGKTTVKNGIHVSTLDTPDEGPETALCDENGAHPVERYETVEKAKTGHNKWVKFAQKAKTGTKITKLGGLSNLVDAKIIKLKLKK